VSERLSSLLIVQLSENAELLGVFTDLFDEEGAEIYLKPAEFYAPLGSEVTYAAVVESGRVRNETVLGYRISILAHDEQANFGVTINPPKSSTIRFEEGDSVIVLAEDHV
jgi:hypothetical protein